MANSLPGQSSRRDAGGHAEAVSGREAAAWHTLKEARDPLACGKGFSKRLFQCWGRTPDLGICDRAPLQTQSNIHLDCKWPSPDPPRGCYRSEVTSGVQGKVLPWITAMAQLWTSLWEDPGGLILPPGSATWPRCCLSLDFRAPAAHVSFIQQVRGRGLREPHAPRPASAGVQPAFPSRRVCLLTEAAVKPLVRPENRTLQHSPSGQPRAPGPPSVPVQVCADCFPQPNS